MSCFVLFISECLEKVWSILPLDVFLTLHGDVSKLGFLSRLKATWWRYIPENDHDFLRLHHHQLKSTNHFFEHGRSDDQIQITMVKSYHITMVFLIYSQISPNFFWWFHGGFRQEVPPGPPGPPGPPANGVKPKDGDSEGRFLGKKTPEMCG